MIIFKQAKLITASLHKERKNGKQIGFVPTMGALHQGHLTLIQTAKSQNNITVCSIFVNPTQFNNPEDFARYPITLEKDIEQLIMAGCDVLFLPPVEEIYPPGYIPKIYPIGNIETVLEGHYRAGHFQGVCQVMDRLLEIVNPHHLYMGQKDFQQCIVVKHLLKLTGRDKTVHLHIQPTVREPDGLAMSSRNLRLDGTEKTLATSIYQELLGIKENLYLHPLDKLIQVARTHLEEKGFMVDYVSIANVSDLTPATDTSQSIIALAAASIGNVRLIDNLVLN